MLNHWFVIQVQSGNEEKIIKYCKQYIDDEILEECFVLKYKHMKKYKGNWHELEEILFKGYVFVITKDPNTLYQQLKKIPGFTKLLGNTGDMIYPIYEEEAKVLMKFGREKHMVEMSTGFIEGDTIYIMEGPLMNNEGIIKKIDRHKRIAYIELKLFNQLTTAQIGLEIIRKNA